MILPPPNGECSLHKVVVYDSYANCYAATTYPIIAWLSTALKLIGKIYLHRTFSFDYRHQQDSAKKETNAIVGFERKTSLELGLGSVLAPANPLNFK